MINNKYYQIAIDGPSGAGKTTIAKKIAEKLNFLFVNTGGMYRCYAIALKDVDLSNELQIQKIMSNNHVSLTPTKLFLNNKDVTELASSAEISALASKIGTISVVRKKCVADQQEIAKSQNVVMEGRDITTTVLPNATLKIFLTASIQERANRRMKQFPTNEIYESIIEAMKNRDFQDSHRSISPLIKTPDAIELNSDNKSINEVVDEIIKLFYEKIRSEKC